MVYGITIVVASILARLLFQIKCYGKEIINEYKTNGRPYIVCPNHVSAIDPVFVIILRTVAVRCTARRRVQPLK